MTLTALELSRLELLDRSCARSFENAYYHGSRLECYNPS